MGMSCCCLDLHTDRTDGSRYSVWWRWNVLTVMHATHRHFKKCKTLVGVDSLNIITADSKMFPAGIFLINGWLFHNHTFATVTACLPDTDESSYLLSNLTSAELIA